MRQVRKPVKRKTTKSTARRRKIDSNWPLRIKLIAAAALLILLSPYYYGYVLKTFSATWQWIKDIGEDPEFPTYSSYDIRIPRKYTIHGIDVSYAQGKIDWQKVKAMEEDDVRIQFAFIKATEGITLVDSYFQRNWREAPKAGIACGAYHYFHPRKSGKQQARFFLQTASFEAGDLPMIADVETLDGLPPERMRKELKAFLSHIEKKTGVKPIIYTGLSFYRDYLNSYFDEYKLWIAHYYKPELKAGANTNWHFWQLSDKAKVSGVNHPVDFNVFKGDSTAFRRLIYY